MIFNEVYDVIDKNGKKIGTSTWTECHRKGLLHQCVHGLVFKNNSKKEILVKQRSLQMEQGPGLWEIAVAGHMLSGTTPEGEIKKEFQEELFSGQKLPKNIRTKYIGNCFNNDIKNNNELVYLFEIVCSGPFFPDAEEVKGKPVWIDFKKVLNDMKKQPTRYAQFSINAINNYLRLT